MTNHALPVAAALLLTGATTARADMLSDRAIERHVDAMIARSHAATWTVARRRTLLASHLSTSVRLLVPIYGSYVLEHRVFGELRPAGIVFDWVLGGAVPALLGASSLFAGNALSSRTRSVLGWTALGLYATTRLGVLIIGNLHISSYNRFVRVRLGLADAGSSAPLLLATTLW